MKKTLLVLTSTFLASCSHLAQEAAQTVQFPYASELLQKVQGVQKNSGRAISSLTEEDFSEKSPRRVYFSALYHQYLTLGQHLGKKAQIKFCPQFHHDKIETDAGLVPKVTLYQPQSIDEGGRDYFPELVFSKDFSLRDYHLLISSEVETLCEEGVSDNFFKFDNLITHYAHKSSFHQDPKAMASVLKIPVFANFYLVKMLEIPGKHHTSSEEKRFIKLTRTQWFENYVTEASRLRHNFIKNKMVRR
jgi:hypothetical protein